MFRQQNYPSALIVMVDHPYESEIPNTTRWQRCFRAMHLSAPELLSGTSCVSSRCPLHRMMPCECRACRTEGDSPPVLHLTRQTFVSDEHQQLTCRVSQLTVTTHVIGHHLRHPMMRNLCELFEKRSKRNLTGVRVAINWVWLLLWLGRHARTHRVGEAISATTSDH